ncbi:hypothetical protein GCM10010405_44180 [Streptomyces macrosporus]|uniref:Uncharacterized protein n=1 Tax=Streptomyces macrosporus TaxID=44032 RepID=A0ABP5XGX5_9ACTN
MADTPLDDLQALRRMRLVMTDGVPGVGAEPQGLGLREDGGHGAGVAQVHHMGDPVLVGDAGDEVPQARLVVRVGQRQPLGVPGHLAPVGPVAQRGIPPRPDPPSGVSGRAHEPVGSTIRMRSTDRASVISRPSSVDCGEPGGAASRSVPSGFLPRRNPDAATMWA